MATVTPMGLQSRATSSTKNRSQPRPHKAKAVKAPGGGGVSGLQQEELYDTRTGSMMMFAVLRVHRSSCDRRSIIVHATSRMFRRFLRMRVPNGHRAEPGLLGEERTARRLLRHPVQAPQAKGGSETVTSRFAMRRHCLDPATLPLLKQ